MDIELGLKLVLYGKTAYHDSPAVVLRQHGNNSGATTPFAEAFKGVWLVANVCRFAVEQGVSESELRPLRHRITRDLVNRFLVGKLLDDRKDFAGNVLRFYREIFRISPVTAWYFIFNPVFFGRLIISRSVRLRSAFRKARGLSSCGNGAFRL